MRPSAAAALSLLASLVLMAGCSPGEDRLPASLTEFEAEPEASWRAQVAAVRAGRSEEIRVAETRVLASDFRDLAAGCEGLTTLALDDADLADADLAVLRTLPRLRWLKLPTAVGDEGAAVIAACRKLEILNLPRATFSDRGLAALATLDRLSLLRFGSPAVTDSGVARLTALPDLRFLHLVDIPITDAALETVASIPALESFYLDGGRVTDAGLRRLLAARPDLHLHLNREHLPGDPNADPHD